MKNKRQQNKRQKGMLRQRFSDLLFFLFAFLLPTQLGKHFFLPFSYLSGVRVDYLAPTVFAIDIVLMILVAANYKTIAAGFKNKYLLIALGVLLIPVVFAKVPMVALYKYVRIVQMVAVFLLVKNARMSTTSLFWGLFAGAVLEAGLGVWQFSARSSIQGVFYYLGERNINLTLPGIAKATLQGVEFLRPYATFSHPNSMGGFYLLLFTFFFTSKKKLLPEPFHSLILFFSTVLVALSFSKVALGAYAAVVFISLIFRKTTYDCAPCTIARVAVLGVLLAVFATAHTDPLSLEKRIVLARNALLLIFTYPLFGVGLGNYLIAQQTLPQPYLFFLNQPVHSVFLLFTTEVGVLISGTAFWIMGLLALRRKTISFLLCFFVVVATGMFDHYWLTLLQNMLLIPVVFGLLERA